MTRKSRIFLAAFVLAAGLFLAACDEDEPAPVVFERSEPIIFEDEEEEDDDIALYEPAYEEANDPEDAVADFVWQYRTIFGRPLTWRWPASGADFLVFDRATGDEVIFDRATGDEVSANNNRPYLRGMSEAAVFFELFHLNDGDIPSVLVGFQSMIANGPRFVGELHVFENGAYRLFGTFDTPRLFIGADDRIMVSRLDWDVDGDNTLYFIDFDDAAGLFSLTFATGDITWVADDEPWAELRSELWIDGRRAHAMVPLEAMAQRIRDGLTQRFDSEFNPAGDERIERYMHLLNELHRQEQQTTRDLAYQALPAHLWPPLTPGSDWDFFPSGNGFIIQNSSDTMFIWDVALDWNYANQSMRPIVPAAAHRLMELSQAELRIARNEIFARHGRRFADEALQAYFDAQPWYIPRLAPGQEPVLSEIERSNVNLLQYLEQGGDLWNPSRDF